MVSGLRNGIEYSFQVTAATRQGAAQPSEPVVATPTTGMEGVVAGLIVEFEPGNERGEGSTNVPGEHRVDEVDLTVAKRVTDDAVLVELSEPVDANTAERIAEDLAVDAAVRWAEPDQFFFTSGEEFAETVSVPADSQYASDQWNLWDSYGIDIGAGNSSMTDAWADSRGEGVTVAVIDTGITSHPDLNPRVVAGYDFVSNPEQLAASRQANAPPVDFDGDYIDPGTYGALGRDDNPVDPGDWRDVAPTRSSSWHGTKMAGLIAAESNDIGITGIAPGAQIQPVRALSWRGGLLSDIAASITWASGGTIDGAPANSTPSKVINMSFSVETTCPTTLQEAIDGALERGSILVAAAGNASDDAAQYAPGNCNGVITVGATNRDGVRSNYSNFGSTIDISAPGGEAGASIITTSDAGTTTPTSSTTSSDYGTSVAAAHVSAAAAIFASRDTTLTPATAYRTLTGNDFTKAFANATCDPGHPDYACGSGILSLSEALAQPAAYSSSTDRSAEYDATKASRASMADITATGTLMAWVKPQSLAYQTVVLAGGPNISINGSWSGRARLTSVNTDLAVRQGEWQHVALTWNATTVSVYVDGALAATGASSTTGTHYGNLEISNPTSAYGRFDGDVDEVKVYSSVLTQSQIVTDMHTHGMNSSVSSSNYVGYYDFNYTESSPATIENLVPGAASNTDLTTSPIDDAGDPLSPPTLNDVASSSTSGSTTTWTFDRSYLTADGGWTVPAAAVTSNALIVGGGGGGGRGTGGGGGGGGVLSYSAGNAPITAGSTVTVTVGMGGLGGSANISTASSGQASLLAAASAGGGGYGGASSAAGGSAPTGSTQRGSGGGAGTTVSGTLAGGSGTYSGGSSSEDPSFRAAAGGGGSSAVGTSGVKTTSSGGSGGAGTANSMSGSSLVYGSGGGGAAKVTGGAGGSGAGTGGSAGAGTSGTVRQGGGGGGSGISGTYTTAGSGGSGVVIVSYTTYTLSYDANGGSGTTPSSETLTNGATTTVASGSGLSRTGYTFNGWKTAPSSGTSYAAGATFTMGSANVTLYAQWSVNTYTVTYDSQGGSAISSGSYTTGGSIADPGNPTRTGYYFNGWFLASSGGSALSFPYSPGTTSNLTLYAQWTIRNYNLSYSTMGATSGAPPLTTSVTYNSTATVAAGTGFSRPGYTFLYWRDPVGGTTYNAGSTITMPARNVQLEAQWAAVSYTYSFDPNGGGNTPAGGTRTIGQSISGTCFGTSRGGYTLTGWESDYDSSVYSTACGTPGFLALSGFTMPASNVVFTAQWSANTYTVTFDSKGGTSVSNGSYSTGGTLAEPTAPTRAGYTFAGWSLTDGGSPVTWTSSTYSPAGYGDFTMYALWVAYSVVYDDNGGSGGPGSIPETAGATVTVSATEPIRTGYTFDGWASSLGGTVVAGDTFTMPSASVTLTAEWTLIPVQPSNGGAGASSSTFPVTVRPTRSADGWEAIGSGFMVVARPRNSEDVSLPLGAGERMEVPRGGKIQVLGDGYQQGSLSEVALGDNTPSGSMATTQASVSPAGDFSTQVTVPPGSPLGTFPLRVSGITTRDGATTVVFWVTVVESQPQFITERVTRASFYQGGSLKFSKAGRQRIAAILDSLPTDATNVEVSVIGVSVTRDSLSANLDLARDRAEKIAKTLEREGVPGTYSVSIATEFIVDAKPRPRVQTIDVNDGSSQIGQPELSSSGKPLSTVRISFQTLTGNAVE